MKTLSWIKKDVSLKHYNTFRINGKTNIFTKNILQKDKINKKLYIWGKKKILCPFLF